jgi:hypothetical protein
MTETSILPTSSEDAEAHSYESQPPEDGVAGPNRRKLFIAGGAGGVVVLAAAAFLLLHHGSSATPTATVVPHGTPKASAPPATSHSGGKSTTKLPKKAKAPAGRNPFNALYVAPTAGTTVGATTTVSNAPTPAPTTTAPAGAPAPTPTPTQTQTTLGDPTSLQLLATHGDKSATFLVGYNHNRFKKFVVIAPKGSSSTGTVFDTEFELIGVQNGEATVQIGDGTPFDLTKGVTRKV